MLDVQVQIYSVDTGNFYSNKESYLHSLNHEIKLERRNLVEERKDIESKFEKFGINKKEIVDCRLDIAEISNANNYGYYIGTEAPTDTSLLWIDISEEVPILKKSKTSKTHDVSWIDLHKRYETINELIFYKNKKAKETKNKLLKILSNKVETNIEHNGCHHTRKLNEDEISAKNIISVFDSYFTRTIGIKQNELSEDFMVIQVFYFDVIKDLIYHGFTYKGEKYIYLTSSAGQIRTKKCVFVKESVWNKYEKTLMCGLTIDDINAKGGNNPNKHLAYLALTNSATDVWEEFDIDKTMVINDFETEVFGTYDLVDDVEYTINRVSDYVPITHTDGAGMMLPSMGKNRMVRLPWVKGLLGVFDFKKFIEENNCSPVIKDIYGKEYDIIADDIQIIFTKSQFKMHKYYDSWDDYKNKYKKYNCTAGIANIEEDKIKDATINYQMLQSLTDITDEEILEIAKPSIEKLNNLCSSINNIKDVFGATIYNTDKTPFQKAIELYPDLINDEYAKFHLRQIKNSMVKKYRAGKLQVHGKYTFILPDFYAACQYWFMGIDNPEGLLKDEEVFCWLFRKSDKLDCLRSPHLYREHAVRNNIACYKYEERQQQLREWFCTDAIYTSCHDLISKILQFDVDGDKSLVVADKSIINVAERNMKEIVPLYYNMKKAQPVHLDSESIYNGLNAAFVGGNIGIYSNNISKIWNSDVFVNGTKEEQQESMKIIKLLCMENNFVIDYAKTLYKPERPKDINELITEYTKNSLPHFFKYAKDKNDNQVIDRNNSFVNKLYDIIPNPRINCRKLGLGEIDYKILMTNPKFGCKDTLCDNQHIIKYSCGTVVPHNATNKLIERCCELSKEYYISIGDIVLVDQMFYLSPEVLVKTSVKRKLKYKKVYDDIRRELSHFGYNEIEVADILIKFLYGTSKSKHKSILWLCYGDIILHNLEKIFKPQTKVIQCVDCGEWFEIGIFDSATERCRDCYDEYRRAYYRNKKSEQSEHRKTKIVKCCDCGNEFEVSLKNNRTIRCQDCNKKHRRKTKTDTMKKLRSK